MKPLSQMNYIEKAKALHQLVPEQIQPFISYMEKTAQFMTANPDKVKDNWGSNRPLSAELWIELAKDMEKRIPKNRKNIMAKANWFADQLFDGYKAMFTIQCLHDYSTICPNSRFNRAIELIFDV